MYMYWAMQLLVDFVYTFKKFCKRLPAKNEMLP